MGVAMRICAFLDTFLYYGKGVRCRVILQTVPTQCLHNRINRIIKACFVRVGVGRAGRFDSGYTLLLRTVVLAEAKACLIILSVLLCGLDHRVKNNLL